jgi:hypothetical protein
MRAFSVLQSVDPRCLGARIGAERRVEPPSSTYDAATLPLRMSGIELCRLAHYRYMRQNRRSSSSRPFESNESRLRIDQNKFNSHQPIRPSQSASVPKATTANTTTPSGICGSRAVSTVVPTTAATSISVAACASVIANALTSQHFVARVRWQVHMVVGPDAAP